MKISRTARPYLTALLILACLSVGAFVALDSLIKHQINSAMLVNVAGRQRMLCEKLALLTLQMATEKAPKAQAALRRDFAETMNTFHKSHDNLVHGNEKLGIEPPPSEALREIYLSPPDNLADKVEDYISLLESLYLKDSKSFTVNDKNLQQALAFSQALLPLLDRAVLEYQKEIQEDVISLKVLQQVVLAVTLLALIFVGWFIFRPLAMSIQKRTQELDHARQEAEKIAQFPINNPNPLLQITQDGQVLYANPAALDLYPTLREDGFAHPILKGLEGYFAAEEMPRNRNMARTREVTDGDITLHQTITTVKTDGQPALVIYSYDMSDIKATREKARLLEAAIVNAKDAVIITTAQMDAPGPEIVYVNESFTRMTGYEPEEAIGKSPKMLQGSDTDKKVLRAMSEALRKGQPFKGELKNYTKDKIAYWLDISIVPVRNEHGHVTHFAAIERDITERKAFEKELTITKEAAEVASRAKGDFLANMSHELRTPMNGIIGLSELLMEMDMSTDQKELAEAVNSSSRNLLILLNDILDLSKIEAGELTLEQIPFDLRRVVRQTIDLLNPMASRKGVVLESTINPIVPDHIMGDPARLQQVLNNLVSNAVKFTEVGYVRVDMTSSRDGAGDHVIHIRVEDSGIGIPEDKQDIIFNKFTQADVSTARKYGGTGLGLAITKELVEMMGGRISLDSVEGRGTTFYVEIPIEIFKGEKKPGAAQKKAEFHIDTTKKLMVVDDHPVNLLFMMKVLKKLGFTHVDEARSGKEALVLFEQRDYDLIFMDCQMPEMDGFEASTRIREMEDFANQTKIIAVTADAMKGAREKCIDAGMNDYISKPVDIEKLKAVLSDWLMGDGSGQQSAQTAPVIAIAAAAEESEELKIMDWDRLRLFTDGDPEEERNLIAMFMSYAQESLTILQEEVGKDDSEPWKKAAHKLKGSAANLGAMALSEKCYVAEKDYQNPSAEKETMLQEILTAYRNLSDALNKEKAAA